MAEPDIRQRIDAWAKAIQAKDIAGALSIYASDVVSFDVNPPLRYAGMENKRRAWEKAFAAYAGPIGYDVHDLEVTTDGELAFAYSLNHVTGKLVNGQTSDRWVRWTACFRRINGAWLIVHDHVSVPADLGEGRAGKEQGPGTK